MSLATAKTTESAGLQLWSSTNDDISAARALDACQVTTRHDLRLRESPWGKLLSIVPRDVTVAGSARTRSWYNIVYDDISGWIAAWLTESERRL